MTTTTVSLDGLRELSAFRAQNGCAISLYLDLDPSIAPTAGDDGDARPLAARHGREVARRDPRRSRARGQVRPQVRLRASRAATSAMSSSATAPAGSRSSRQGSTTSGVCSRCPGRSRMRRASPTISCSRPLVPLLGRGNGALVAVVGREQGRAARAPGRPARARSPTGPRRRPAATTRVAGRRRASSATSTTSPRSTTRRSRRSSIARSGGSAARASSSSAGEETRAEFAERSRPSSRGGDRLDGRRGARRLRPSSSTSCRRARAVACGSARAKRSSAGAKRPARSRGARRAGRTRSRPPRTAASSCCSTRGVQNGRLPLPLLRRAAALDAHVPARRDDDGARDDGLDLAVRADARARRRPACRRAPPRPRSRRGDRRDPAVLSARPRRSRAAARRARAPAAAAAARPPATSSGAPCRTRCSRPACAPWARTALLERADGVVVRPDRALEAAADLVQVPADDRDALVELAPERLDLAGILRDVSCCQPYAIDCEQHDQRGRRRDVDARAHARLDERRVLLPRRAEEALVGQEHDDEVGRVPELLPVALGAELATCARGPGARALARCTRALVVLGRLARVQVRGERDLCVDDDDLAAREPHDEVGAERAHPPCSRSPARRSRSGQHPGQLDDALELDLAPAPADVRRPQRSRQRRRPLAQLRQLLSAAPRRPAPGPARASAPGRRPSPATPSAAAT